MFTDIFIAIKIYYFKDFGFRDVEDQWVARIGPVIQVTALIHGSIQHLENSTIPLALYPLWKNFKSSGNFWKTSSTNPMEISMKL